MKNLYLRNLTTYLGRCPLRTTGQLRFVVLLLLLLGSVSLFMTQAYAQQVASFAYTGAVQTFTVPTGVTTLTVVANGAKGGNANGGNGGRVTATLSVTAGQVLNLYVGGVPFNGGGGNSGAGSGGGATDIRIGGTALSNRRLVAGGGGGGGQGAGGAGGGLTGGAGTSGGGGGTQAAGGTAGSGGVVGTLGSGGNGGGGGGGGYYGGGGATRSGGGGSSFTNAALAASVVHVQGANSGNGTITITWCDISVSISPASQTITSGESATLTGSGADTYRWSNGSTANPLIINLTSGTSATTVATVSVTGTTGTCSVTASAAVTLLPSSPASFTYTGAAQTFVVPMGVTTVRVVANGAKGYDGPKCIGCGAGSGGGAGGAGGRVTATLSVTAGQVLNLYVGGVPFNGGSSNTGGNAIGGSGGGATDIRIGGTELSNRVLVAGGGGGGAQDTDAGLYGGAGGGLTGGNARSYGASGGYGGTQAAGGAGGSGASAGTLGNGGAPYNSVGFGDGGAGGGYYGGGGGGYPASGGGGGSSYTDPALATNVVHVQGANSGNGTMTLSWSDAPACVLSVSISPASQTITSGGSATLTASGADTYTWSNGSSTTAIVVSNVTSATAFSVTGTTGACSATASAALSVTACAPPTATLNVSGALSCNSPTINIVAGGGTSYTFSAGATQTGGTTGNTASITTAGIYSVTVANAAGCTNTASLTVIADKTPPTATLTATSPTFCVGSQVTLTAGGGTHYDFSAGASQNGQNTAFVTASGSYSAIAYGNNGCTSFASVSVTAVASPTVSIGVSPSLTITQGQSATLTASGATSYLWSTGATTAAISASTAATYSVTGTTGACSATASAALSVTAAPVNPCVFVPQAITVSGFVAAYAAYNGVYAPNGMVNNAPRWINGSNHTIQWSGTSWEIVGGITPPIPTVYAYNTTGSITNLPCSGWTPVDSEDGTPVLSGGCGPLTVPPLMVTPASQTITSGGSATLTASGAASYLWSNGTTTNPLIVSNVTSATAYSVTGTTGACSATASAALSVTMAPVACNTPYVPSSITVQNACGSELSGVYQPSGTFNGAPKWSFYNGGNTAYLQWSGSVWQLVDVESAQRAVSAAGSATFFPTTGWTGNCSSGITFTGGVGSLTGSAGLTVSIAASPSLTITQGQSATLTASGATSYLWSTGATTAAISASTASTYSVTGTTGACSATASAALSVTACAPPTATLNVSGALSCNSPTINIVAGGGTSYTFSAGATQTGGTTGNTASITTAGIYSVTVANAAGCTNTASLTVIADKTPPTATLTAASPTFCVGSQVILTAGGGTHYDFSAGASQNGQNTASVTASGSYTAIAYGNNGCTSFASVSVTAVASPTVSIGVSPSLTITQGQSATLTASGATTYLWNTGATTAAISATAGVYSVTGTSSGCSSTTSVSVFQRECQTTLTASAPQVCVGKTISLTATAQSQVSQPTTNGLTDPRSVGGPTYSWLAPAGATLSSTNSSVVSASFTTSGLKTFTATVTTVDGCVSTTTVSVTVNPAATAGLINNGPLSCSTTSVTLTASGGNTYSFSSGATPVGTGPTTTVSTAGVYSVTVTSAAGCMSTTSTTVTSDTAPPTATLVSSNTLTCAITSTTLTATGGASYAFSGPGVVFQSGNTAVVDASGTYSVTVIGANGCPAISTTTVSTDTSTPVANLVVNGTLTCAQTSVTLTASGGVSYVFAGPGVISQSGNRAVVNISGTYSVTVTNANGCLATANVGVSQDNTFPTASLVSSGNLSCAQTSVTLTAGAAGSGISYAFSAGASQIGSSNQAVVSSAGVYSVTVTNGNGCQVSASVTVSGSTTAPTASLVSSGTLSCTQTTVTLTASGGGSYTFSGPGVVSQSGNTAVVNVAGQYSVSVTGSSGCQATASVGVSQDNTAPTASITGTLTVVAGGTTTLTASGGSRYGWSTGQTTASISVTAGVYSLTVTSANGCFATTSATVTTVAPANTAPTVVNPISPQSMTVGVGFTLSVASVFTDTETPNGLVLTVAGLPAGLSLNETTISGTPSTTVGSPVSVTLTASDPGGLSAYTVFTLMVSPASLTVSPPPTGVFAITGVSGVSCVTLSAGQRSVSFSPQYAGLDSSPIAFSVVNELAATTSPGPYTLRLYTDNPVITLRAVQSGVSSSYAYNWLSGCSSGTQPPGNTAPTVVNPISPQSMTVGVGFTLSVASVFTDTETPNGLVLTVAGLPAGLSLNETTISGTPSTTVGSPVSVTLTASDPGGLSAYTVFTLTVSPAGSTQPPVSTACGSPTNTIGQPLQMLAPTYDCATGAIKFNTMGGDGSPVSFSAIGVTGPTTNCNGFVDRETRTMADAPPIQLTGTQNGVMVIYAFNIRAQCPSGGRQAANESAVELSVKVLDNPSEQELVIVEIRGGEGSGLRLTTTDSRGVLVSEQTVGDARAIERPTIRIGSDAGIYLLQVTSSTQTVTTRIMKR